MADITIKVSFDKLTLDDLVAIEEGDQSAKFVRSILSRFIVDEATGDHYPDQAQSIKAAGKLSVTEALSVVNEIAKQVQELKAAKIPPTSGGN